MLEEDLSYGPHRAFVFDAILLRKHCFGQRLLVGIAGFECFFDLGQHLVVDLESAVPQFVNEVQDRRERAIYSGWRYVLDCFKWTNDSGVRVELEVRVGFDINCLLDLTDRFRDFHPFHQLGVDELNLKDVKSLPFFIFRILSIMP